MPTRRRRHPFPRVPATTSLVGALSGALISSPAHALDEDLVASPAIHLIFQFGQHPLEVGLGVDLRLTKILDFQGSCLPREAWTGIGGYVRATWFFIDSVQVGAGVHLAFETEASDWVVDTDLGWTWKAAPGGKQHGLELGLSYGKFPIDLALARVGLAFADDGPAVSGQLGLGARAPGTFDKDGGTCIIGRPLRVAGQQRLAPFSLGPATRSAEGLAPETRTALGRAWLEAARAERASVPAFIALAHDLARADAPHALIRRAVAAAHDERRHARLCEDLVARSTGSGLRTYTPPLPPQHEDREARFVRLALESWSDGCIGEATAARRAERGFAGMPKTKHPATRAALHQIARDEHRHAELAWSVLEHTLERGGRRVRDAVAAAVREVSPPSEDEETRGARRSDPRAWRALGRLDHEAVLSCHEAVTRDATRRVRALLDRRTRV